jgi:hypothetical protein
LVFGTQTSHHSFQGDFPLSSQLSGCRVLEQG